MTITQEPPLVVVGFRSTGGEAFRSTGGEVFRSTGGEGLAKVKAEPSALAWISFINYENVHMGVSENSGTPKSSILIGFSTKKTIHFGEPLFLETSIWKYENHHVTFKRENRIRSTVCVRLWAGDVSTWPAGASCLQLTYPSTSIDSQRNWYWRSDKFPDAPCPE